MAAQRHRQFNGNTTTRQAALDLIQRSLDFSETFADNTAPLTASARHATVADDDDDIDIDTVGSD